MRWSNIHHVLKRIIIFFSTARGGSDFLSWVFIGASVPVFTFLAIRVTVEENK